MRVPELASSPPWSAVVETGSRPRALGELLVGGTRYLRLLQPHQGSVESFAQPVPLDASLAGLTASAQGVCTGGGVALSNALDLRLGF